MDHTELESAKQILLSRNCTCVLYREGTVYTSNERGVKPLVSWLDSGLDLRRFSAADRVVGKATAFLYCLLGVCQVYAGVMSKGALEVFSDYGIYAEYDTLAEHIINRRKTGYCPFELAVWELHKPEEALPAIREKMEQMHLNDPQPQ